MQAVFPEIEKTLALVRPLPCAWWVAGGWGLDMFLGKQTRPHQDIEIAIARADQKQLLLLPGLAGIEYVEDKELKPWRGQALELPVHELHARFYTGETLEILLNEFDADDWIFRRNKNIRLPRTAFAGKAHLPAEVILLYKSKNPRPQDEQDFSAALERLDSGQCRWLSESIFRDYPAHSWLKKLGHERTRLTDASRGKF